MLFMLCILCGWYFSVLYLQYQDIQLLILHCCAVCCIIILTVMCCIIFCHCFCVLHCCTHCILLLHPHVTSVISYIVIYSYNIPLFTCYVSCRGCMYDAIVTVERCLSINNINKCM